MMQFKHAVLWKQGLASALTIVLLLAAGCGAESGNAEKRSTAAPDSTAVTAAATQPTEAPQQTEAPIIETENEATEPTMKQVIGVISDENKRFNQFLTGFVQQEIGNTKTELDEDAELVRFVFRYLQTNDPDSVLEQEDGGKPCRVLTLEQVNETLNTLMGRTLTPDREDYSILVDGAEEFHCRFQDGRFVHTQPYHTFAYGFPLRFALVEKVDMESNTLYFRLYRVNPISWEPGEADRHIPLLPLFTIASAELNHDIARIGTGVAVLRDLSEENLQLVEFETDFQS